MTTAQSRPDEAAQRVKGRTERSFAVRRSNRRVIGACCSRTVRAERCCKGLNDAAAPAMLRGSTSVGRIGIAVSGGGSGAAVCGGVGSSDVAVCGGVATDFPSWCRIEAECTPAAPTASPACMSAKFPWTRWHGYVA